MLRGKLLLFLWYNKRAQRNAPFLTHKPNSRNKKSQYAYHLS